jgi:uncharacterized protein (TIGR00255 family)
VIKSMTGFASLTRETGRAAVSVTVRAVNHRHLDVQVRLPAAWADLEARLRAVVQRRVARGRVELGVAVEAHGAPSVEVVLNEPLLDALESALDRARARGVVQGPLTPGDLLRVPQALVVREAVERADEPARQALAEAIEAAVADAVEALDAMRAREGEYLRADLAARHAHLAALVEKLARVASEGQAAAREKLQRAVEALGAELRLDPQAVAQEVVRYVARSDTSEELVRLRGHLDHWQHLVDAPEPCGRALEFLVQEMHRELNTFAAKAEGAGLGPLVVEAKNELERVREQVQNVE